MTDPREILGAGERIDAAFASHRAGPSPTRLASVHINQLSVYGVGAQYGRPRLGAEQRFHCGPYNSSLYFVNH